MKTIREDIKINVFKPVYLLYGEEGYLVNQYRKKLVEAVTGDNDFNLTIVSEKPDWDEIKSLAETMPFMSEYRMIVFDRCSLFKGKDEKALSFFSGDFPAYLVVVIAEDAADKRLSLYKTIAKKGHVCELKTRSEDDVLGFIFGKCEAEGKSIDKKTALEIYSRTLGDLGLVAGEMEKLFAYTSGRIEISLRDVDSVCSIRVEAKVFDMIESISYKKKQEALAMYFDLMAVREAPMKIFILLEKHFANLWRVSANPSVSSGELAKILGVMPFVAGKYLKQANGFTTERLKEIVASFLQTEEDIKSGRITDRTACELMIAEAML